MSKIIMDSNKILKNVQKLHDNAKDGACIINKTRYELKFNRLNGWYEVFVDGQEYEFTRLNTRKITMAKQWLKEWFTN